jgi:hypothetical protein
MNPTIVVLAYNRPGSLKRLLSSLTRASYPPDHPVDLVFSIDRREKGIDPEVASIAEEYRWPYGKKRLVCHDKHMGLVANFYFSGNLSVEYGSIILLEDDLLVSPMYYQFASQALQYYQGDDRIAGISLYSLWFNGYTQFPFIPLMDESDIFFLQVPYTQGQAFTGAQWQRFASWRSLPGSQPKAGDHLHEMFLNFDAEDWFPIRTKYLVETDRYYVFPRQSLSTGMGDVGTHFSKSSAFFQVPLQGSKDRFLFKIMDQSLSVYDSFFEILPGRLDRLVDWFKGINYATDLNGTKSRHNIQADFVLTSRPGKSPLNSFGKLMWPMEANIIENIPGREIVFCDVNNLDWSWLGDLKIKMSSHAYFTRHRRTSKKLLLQFTFLELLYKLSSRQNHRD